jgi:hypothetical protein
LFQERVRRSNYFFDENFDKILEVDFIKVAYNGLRFFIKDLDFLLMQSGIIDTPLLVRNYQLDVEAVVIDTLVNSFFPNILQLHQKYLSRGFFVRIILDHNFISEDAVRKIFSEKMFSEKVFSEKFEKLIENGNIQFTGSSSLTPLEKQRLEKIKIDQEIMKILELVEVETI